jgi:cytochrome c553
VEAGKKFFSQSGCTLCHGEDASGKSMAPALRGLKAYYTKDKLIAYLENPMEYAKADQRLTEQAPKYSGAMPGYAMLGKEKLEAMADYLLSL